MTTRQFTISELAALGVPPDDPRDVEYSQTVIVDQAVTTLKYSEQRRCIFFDATGAQLWAVTYEAQLRAGHYETGPSPDNHGWHGDTVEATAVEERAVIVKQWVPLTGTPATVGPRTGPIESLTAILEQTGATPEEARTAAAKWIVDYAGEAADLRDEYLFAGDDL